MGKCTCASVKPGTTQRPPRSTRSGVGRAVSCVPTPPAMRSPAIGERARRRQRGVHRPDRAALEDHACRIYRGVPARPGNRGGAPSRRLPGGAARARAGRRRARPVRRPLLLHRHDAERPPRRPCRGRARPARAQDARARTGRVAARAHRGAPLAAGSRRGAGRGRRLGRSARLRARRAAGAPLPRLREAAAGLRARGLLGPDPGAASGEEPVGARAHPRGRPPWSPASTNASPACSARA